MKKTKWIIVILMLLLVAPSTAFCQSLAAAGSLEHGTIPHPIYVPYSPAKHTAFKTTSASIVPIFDPSITDASEKDAIIYACQIWSEILPGPAFRIYFTNATFAPLAFTSVYYQADFSSFDPRYYPDIEYPAPLAGKLNGANLNLANPYDIRIQINFAGYDWNTALHGGATSSEYDLVRAVEHEIGHGVGFTTSLASSGPDIIYPRPGLPFPCIYDKYVSFPTGDLLSFTSPSADLNDACTGGDALWTGTLASGAHLYCPGFWEDGVSICHTDDAFYFSNDLMQHLELPGDCNHNPTDVDMNILNDIGWDCVTTVGIEDNIEIDAMVSGASPASILHEGSTYGYDAWFNDEAPHGDYLVSYSWSLKALSTTGPVELVTYAAEYFWPTIPTLPSGYTWIHDINGNVQGYLSVHGTDNHGYSHSSAMDIGIVRVPEKPIMKILNKSAACDCDKARISFSAPGADHYVLWEKAGPAAWSIVSTLSPGVNYYNVSGLNQYIDYQFKVDAVNSSGTVTSNVMNHPKCKHYVFVSPNPVISSENAGNVCIRLDPINGVDGGDYLNTNPYILAEEEGPRIIIGGNGVNGGTGYVQPCPLHAIEEENPAFMSFLISQITIVNIADPRITYSQPFPGDASTVNFNASNVQPGNYTLTAISTSGETASTVVQILQ